MTEARAGLVLLAAFVAAGAGLFALSPAIPQDPAYHAFADARACGGIPNAQNVLTNLVFAATGAWGLALTLGPGGRPRDDGRCRDAVERTAFATLFLGISLVALGSAYYHRAPSHATLLWDRLPMSVAFMALFALVIGDRIGARAGKVALAPLLALGLASVLWWSFGEARGAGDLRLYVLVQGFPILAVPALLALRPGRAPGAPWLLLCVGLYALAKVTEAKDAEMFAATGEVISGHAAKHLLAGLGTGCLALWLRAREAPPPPRPSETAA